MKKLLSTLFLALALPVLAVDQIEVFIAITNTPVTGDTLTISGDSRTWTNAQSSTTILTNLVSDARANSTTNLYNNLATYVLSDRPVILYSETNQLRLIFRAGLTPSASEVGDYAEITYVTNSLTRAWTVRVPHTIEAATNQTNFASMLVTYLEHATNGLAYHWPVLSQTAGLTNNNALTGTNSLAQGGWNNASITNLLSLSGIINSITNGYWTNGVLGDPVTTNLVNYGNAISSPGSGTSSEQFGTGATATGDNATAVGDSADASGVSGIAIGSSALASGPSDIAIGAGAEGGWGNNIVIGTGAAANATNGIAIGNGAIVAANDTNSIAIGNNVTTTKTNQILLGNSSHLVEVGGLLTATLTNATTHGVSAFGTTGGPYGSIRYSRYNNTSLANGGNAAVNPNGATYMKVSGPSASFSIDGLTNVIGGNLDGYRLIIQNSTGQSMSLADQSGVEPIPGNRIVTTYDDDLVIGTSGAATLIYDSALSRWVVVSAKFGNAYGELVTISNTVSQTLNSTIGVFDKLTNWTSEGLSAAFGLETALSGQNMTNDVSGVYDVLGQFSFSGTSSSTMTLALYTNGVISHIILERKLGTGGDVGSAGFSGLVYLPANAVCDVRASASGSGDSITVRRANLLIQKLK